MRHEATTPRVAAEDERVERVVICTPDKDLGQCVGGKVWQWDRRQDKWFDAAGVHERLGVAPASIPDLLALVGDSADGYPGLAGWGAKSAARVLAAFGHIERIPDDHRLWGVDVARAGMLAAVLKRDRAQALLFRELATIRTDVPVFDDVDELAWRGPTPAFADFEQRLASATHPG